MVEPTATSEIVRLFPTFVWRSRLGTDARATVRRALLEQLRALRAGLPELERGEVWQSRHGLHAIPDLAPVVHHIRRSIEQVLAVLQVGTASWPRLISRSASAAVARIGAVSSVVNASPSVASSEGSSSMTRTTACMSRFWAPAPPKRESRRVMRMTHTRVHASPRGDRLVAGEDGGSTSLARTHARSERQGARSC